MNKHKNYRPASSAMAGQHTQTLKRLHLAVGSVIDGLPDDDLAVLLTFWDQPYTPPEGIVCEPPSFALCPDLIQMMKAKGSCMPMDTPDGKLFLFDPKFVNMAPQEALVSSIALLVAEAFTYATGSWSNDDEEQSANERELLSRWRRSEEDLSVWIAAEIFTPREPVAGFYAFRYAEYHLQPPVTADLGAISRALRRIGKPHLAAALLQRRNSQN